MANVYIGDLPLKTSIETTDSLVGYINGTASRITYEDLMEDVTHSETAWADVTNKPFDGIDTEVLAIASDANSGSTLLTFSSAITDELTDLSTRLTTAEGDIDTVEGDITTLGTSVTNVSNTATATQTKVTALNSLYATTTTLARTCGYNVLQTLDSNNNYLTFALNGKDGSPYNNEDLQSCLFTLSNLTIGSVPTYNSSNQRWSLSLNTSSAMSSGYTIGVIKGKIFDEEWTSGRNYTQGVVVVNNNQLYKCLTDNNDDTFDSTKWQQITSGGGGSSSFSIVSGVFKHTDWRVIDNRQYAEAHNGQPNEFPYICKCCVMNVDSIVNPDNIMLVDQDNFDYNTPPPVLAQGIMMFDNDSQYANDEARGFYNRIIHTNADLRVMPLWYGEEYDSDVNPQSQRPFPWGDVWSDKGGWEGFTIYLDYREDTPAVDIPVALLVTN